MIIGYRIVPGAFGQTKIPPQVFVSGARCRSRGTTRIRRFVAKPASSSTPLQPKRKRLYSSSVTGAPGTPSSGIGFRCAARSLSSTKTLCSFPAAGALW